MQLASRYGDLAGVEHRDPVTVGIATGRQITGIATGRITGIATGRRACRDSAG